MRCSHSFIIEIRVKLNRENMSYAVLARMTGVHLSKLKRIFSGRQEITQCDCLAIGE